MTVPTNERLLAVINEHYGDPRALYFALLEREDEILDGLRLAAAAQGLMPSITQLVLCQTGLGTPVTAEQFVLIREQAEAEVRQINETLRRMQGEGGDSP